MTLQHRLAVFSTAVACPHSCRPEYPVDLLLAIGEVALVFACLLGLVHVADRVWRRRKR